MSKLIFLIFSLVLLNFVFSYTKEDIEKEGFKIFKYHDVNNEGVIELQQNTKFVIEVDENDSNTYMWRLDHSQYHEYLATANLIYSLNLDEKYSSEFYIDSNGAKKFGVYHFRFMTSATEEGTDTIGLEKVEISTGKEVEHNHIYVHIRSNKKSDL